MLNKVSTMTVNPNNGNEILCPLGVKHKGRLITKRKTFVVEKVV